VAAEGLQQRGHPKNTIRHFYQTDLQNLNASFQSKWADIRAAASMRYDWQLFLDAKLPLEDLSSILTLKNKKLKKTFESWILGVLIRTNL